MGSKKKYNVEMDKKWSKKLDQLFEALDVFEYGRNFSLRAGGGGIHSN